MLAVVTGEVRSRSVLAPTAETNQEPEEDVGARRVITALDASRRRSCSLSRSSCRQRALCRRRGRPIPPGLPPPAPEFWFVADEATSWAGFVTGLLCLLGTGLVVLPRFVWDCSGPEERPARARLLLQLVVAASALTLLAAALRIVAAAMSVSGSWDEQLMGLTSGMANAVEGVVLSGAGGVLVKSLAYWSRPEGTEDDDVEDEAQDDGLADADDSPVAP